MCPELGVARPLESRVVSASAAPRTISSIPSLPRCGGSVSSAAWLVALILDVDCKLRPRGEYSFERASCTATSSSSNGFAGSGTGTIDVWALFISRRGTRGIPPLSASAKSSSDLSNGAAISEVVESSTLPPAGAIEGDVCIVCSIPISTSWDEVLRIHRRLFAFKAARVELIWHHTSGSTSSTEGTLSNFKSRNFATSMMQS